LIYIQTLLYLFAIVYLVVWICFMQDVFSLPPGKALLQLLIPITTGFVIMMIIDFADLIIARMLSNEAVAILAICYPIIYLMLAIGIGLNQGLTIVGTEAFVRKGRAELYSVLVQALFLAMILTLFIQFMIFICIHYKWISVSFLPYLNEIKCYLYIVVSGVFPVFSVLLLYSLCQIEGKLYIIRDTLVFMFLLTVCLHPLIVFPIGLNLKINGIAISKIVVCALGAIYAACRIICWKTFFSTQLTLDLTKVKKLSAQVFPAIVIQMLVPCYLLFLTKLVALQGIEATAAFSLGYRIVMVVVIPILGAMIALMVMVAHDFLLQKYDRIKETVKLCLFWGSLSIFSTLCLTYFASYWIFYACDALSDVEWGALGYIKKAIFFTTMEFIIGVITVSFQALRKPLIAFFIASCRTLLIPLPVFYYLSLGNYPIYQIWNILTICFSVSCIIAISFSYHLLWKKY